jgi:hypothetical protein
MRHIGLGYPLHHSLATATGNQRKHKTGLFRGATVDAAPHL